VEEGNRLIQFHYEGIFEEILDQLGQMPLPPYITHQLSDKNRYQTVYAKYDGSAAAPTAGLHFTPELLEQVKDMGVTIAEVTLHVGLGTFRPVKETDVLKHHMHSEFYRIEKSEADKINRAKREGHRVIAVGTTSTRTLEAASDEQGFLRETSGWTEIFYLSGVSVQGDRRTDYEFSSAGIHAGDAGVCACRQRACTCGLRDCCEGALPLFQLRGRHVHHGKIAAA